MAFISTGSRSLVKALQSKFISEVVNLLISIAASAGGAGAVRSRRHINKNKKDQAAATTLVQCAAGRAEAKAAIIYQIHPVKVWSYNKNTFTDKQPWLQSKWALLCFPLLFPDSVVSKASYVQLGQQQQYTTKENSPCLVSFTHLYMIMPQCRVIYLIHVYI